MRWRQLNGRPQPAVVLAPDMPEAVTSTQVLPASAADRAACAADPEVDAKLTRIDRAYQAELARLTQQAGKHK